MLDKRTLFLTIKTFLFIFFGKVKNPVRTNDVRWREHGVSSMEKAIDTWGLIANGRRWSAPKTTWPFIPARESGACWLFHVMSLYDLQPNSRTRNGLFLYV
jgi:hypothetical protein